MTTDKEAIRRVVLRENPQYLAKLRCGHVIKSVFSPIIGWAEWCITCKDFIQVVEGV